MFSIFKNLFNKDDSIHKTPVNTQIANRNVQGNIDNQKGNNIQVGDNSSVVFNQGSTNDKEKEEPPQQKKS